MTPQESVQDTKNLPPALSKLVAGYSWQPVTGGRSGTTVFKLQKSDSTDLYLKMNPCPENAALFEEKLRLDWIGNRLPVPSVRFFGEDEAREYLLLSAVPGVDATDSSLQGQMEQVVGVLAAGLRQIHALPIQNCPFDQRLEHRLEAARTRLLNGEVDESEFEGENRSRDAAQLYNELLSTAPESEDLVFTHGDFCLPNIIIHRGAISGFIDWGSAGIADKYQDLALAVRSLRHNFGAAWGPVFLREYGLDKPDRFKIEFYTLLDEFF
ncbi:MAG: aminoglycoside 3'-phosphotransferase [Abitibacteriaceae bacterium]|nr:aminoglycoside 3'-phosphotransferase [Abditibacteriaceae bacterium]